MGFDQNDLHDRYQSGNHWTSRRRRTPTNEFINWGFNNPQTLDTIYIWNHQRYDVTLFDLTLFDEFNDVLLSLNDLQLSPNSNKAQAFSFGSVVSNVSRVRFDVDHTRYTGLAEVGFNTASIPEPLTILGAGTALAFGPGFKRKLGKAKKKTLSEMLA